jgi:hypothetical protein
MSSTVAPISSAITPSHSSKEHAGAKQDPAGRSGAAGRYSKNTTASNRLSPVSEEHDDWAGKNHDDSNDEKRM